MTYLPTDVNTSTDMMRWVNESATLNGSGILFPGIIILVFSIMTIKMLTNQNLSVSKAMGSAAFVAMILSVFARVIGLVSNGFMLIWIGLMALFTIWMYLENR